MIGYCLSSLTLFLTMISPTPHLPEPNLSEDIIDVTPYTAGVGGEAKTTALQGNAAALSGIGLALKTPPNGDAISSPGGALVARGGNFGTFLAPLSKERFREVVTDVEQKLRIVNQTLSMLDMQGFDTILEEMLSSITLKTGELLNADRTTIWLLDPEKGELYTTIAQSEGGQSVELRIPADRGIVGEVATSRRVVNIPFDFYDDPRSVAAKQIDKKNNYRTYTMLTMPLENEQGDLVAVVQLINKLKPDIPPQADLEQKIDRRGFTSEDEKVFEDFAPSIRLTLESSRSFYVATQRQRAANALIQATQSLSKSSLDLEDTLKKVMDEAKKLMNADRSTLWLIDAEKDQLWTKIPINDKLTELRIPRGAGFAGQVATTGEPLLIPFDLYDHPNSQTSKETDQKTGYRTCSMLCMPIFNADGDLIGVTQLVNKIKQGEYPAYDPANYPEAPECWKASFNRTDQEFMTTFNIQAGVALQNAKLFETVKQQEQMQRDILRSLTNGVISTDREGIIISANESAKEILGLPETTSLEGRNIQDLMKLKKADFYKWFNEALVSDNAEEYYPDQTLECADEVEERSINLAINTIADATDKTKVSGALVVMEDISDEKRLKLTMSRYMSEEVARQLLENPDAAKMGGDRKEVSVLFSDIRSYTTITESLTAEEVVKMLNDYFETMVDAVFAYKGTLDKYIGDAIMAVYGSPLPLKDHEWMAVQTAIEMRQRLTEFNKAWVKQNEKYGGDRYQPIRIGIGINSDTVISGNIGSTKRMEFTAIGDGVNLGSRLESASKQYGTDIIISEYTYRPCADKVWARELDYIRVKGKNKPVAIYELLGLRSEPIPSHKQEIIEHYHEGLRLYRNRDFPMAMAEFAKVRQLAPDDKSAQLHIERCSYWLTTPPADDWDGSWTLESK